MPQGGDGLGSASYATRPSGLPTIGRSEKRNWLNPVRLRLEVFTSRCGLGGYDPDALFVACGPEAPFAFLDASDGYVFGQLPAGPSRHARNHAPLADPAGRRSSNTPAPRAPKWHRRSEDWQAIAGLATTALLHRLR